MGSRARWWAVATAISVAMVSVGCSSGEAADPKPVATSKPTTTTSSTTTTVATTTTTSKWTPDQQQAVDAFQGFYDAYITVIISGGTSEPLADHAGGDFLTKLRIAIQTSKQAGIATRRPPNSLTRSSVKSVNQVDGGWAVETCEVNDLARVKVADGSVVDDAVVTDRLVYSIGTVDGALKVVDMSTAQTLPGDVMDKCLAGS